LQRSRCHLAAAAAARDLQALLGILVLLLLLELL
jgi:hypothetical protein